MATSGRSDGSFVPLPTLQDLPAVDSAVDRRVGTPIRRMAEAVQALIGTRGDPLDKAITFRDAISLGLTSDDGVPIGGGGGAPAPGPAGPPGPPGVDGTAYTPDLTAPPSVTGLTASAGLTTIIVQWDAATYTQGHGHGQTNIYAAKRAIGAPAATFGDAVRVYDATGALTIAPLPSELSTRWHIWAKWQTKDGAESTSPTGGTNGVIATTGVIGTTDLGPLIVEAGNLASGAVTASKVAAGALDATKFAASIEPITIVVGSTLPTTLSTRTIYLTGTGKLYRWDGAAYVASVPAADITGTLADAQIAALAASKITGTLTDAQLAAISAAKVTGQLVASQLNIAIGGGNLAGNSSMESRTGNRPLGYTIYNNAAIDVTLLSAAGRTRGLCYALRADANGASTFGVYGSNGVDGVNVGGVIGGWQPGNSYVISFYAAKANGSGMAGMALEWNTSPAATTVVASPNLTTSFQRYVFRITWGASVEGSGRILARAAGTIVTNDIIYVDDIQVEEGDYLTAYAPRTDEILPGTITATEIADNAITTPKLIAGAVVAGKIAANAVSATEIQAGAITTTKLAAGAVTANELAAGSVVAGKIAAGSIVSGDIAASTITGSNIAGGTITGAKIAAGTIQASNIAADTITANEIAANAITSNELQANSVVAGKIAAGAVNAAQIVAGAISTDKLLVTSTGAMNSDPTIEDVTAWTTDAGGTPISGGTTISSGSVVAGIAGSTYFRNATGGSNAQCFSRYITIDPAKTYLLTANLYSDSGNDRNMYLFVDMYDNAGARVSTAWGGSLSGYVYGGPGPSNSTFARYGAQFGAGTAGTIPSNVRTCRVGIWFQYSLVGSTSLVQAAQDIRLEKVSGSELIVDGAITANKIAANAIAVGTAAIQNGAIVNAMIGNATIDDAKIASLSVAKLLAGTMQVGAYIQSTNYTSGPSGNGFKINADGTAELQAAYIRGQLVATQIAAWDATAVNAIIGSATINSAKLTGAIQSDNFVSGTSGWQIRRDTGAAEFAAATIRGQLTTGQLAIGSVSSNSVIVVTGAGNQMPNSTSDFLSTRFTLGTVSATGGFVRCSISAQAYIEWQNTSVEFITVCLNLFRTISGSDILIDTAYCPLMYRGIPFVGVSGAARQLLANVSSETMAQYSYTSIYKAELSVVFRNSAGARVSPGATLSSNGFISDINGSIQELKV